jgi:hypothetical protein
LDIDTFWELYASDIVKFWTVCSLDIVTFWEFCILTFWGCYFVDMVTLEISYFGQCKVLNIVFFGCLCTLYTLHRPFWILYILILALLICYMRKFIISMLHLILLAGLNQEEGKWGHVAHMGELRSIYRMLVGIPEGKPECS